MLSKYVIYLLLFVPIQIYGQQPSVANEPGKPNIVLINVDDLGWKDTGFMGSQYYETPNLDQLAREGMVFYNAYAGASNCAPSRACLISGLNTPRHGVYTVSPSDRGNPKTRKLIPVENTDHLMDTLYTLPRMLKSAGYITGSFGKWHVGDDPGRQGIDTNVGGSAKGNPGGGGYFSPYRIDHITDGPRGEYLTDRLTQEAIAFMEKNRDTTFFVYLPYYSVHTPITAKKKLVKRFRDKAGSNGQHNPEYAAMVYSVDENVGKLLDHLKGLGLENKTLVIFTSDNGGVRAISGQNPLRAGKGSYYEGGIRVPLVIKWPGKIAPESKSRQRVSNLDFYPTLQHIANPRIEASQLDGISLWPLLQGKEVGERDLFFHFPIYLQEYDMKKDDGRDPLFRTRPGSVIISGDWKLHEYFEDGAVELYNLQQDEGERNNLATRNPEKAAELLTKLKTWRTLTTAPIPSESNGAYDAGVEQQLLRKVDGG